MTTEVIPPTTPEAPVPFNFKQMLAGMPPEYAGNPNLTKHETLESLLKSHLHAQDFIGRDKIVKPNKEDVHDIARYLTDLGRPAPASEDAPVQLGEGVSDAIGWDEGFEQRINQAVFDSGITGESQTILMPKLIGILQEEADGMHKQGEDHAHETIAALKQKYGAQLEAKMDAGNRALERFFPGWKEFRDKQFMDGTRIGNTMEFIEAQIAMGERWMMDDESNIGSGPRTPRGIDQASAAAQIKQKESDPEFRKKWLNKAHPQHDEALEELNVLYSYAHPEG